MHPGEAARRGDDRESPSSESFRPFLLVYVLPALLYLGVIFLPLILGNETLYLRDVFSGHFQMKSAQAKLMHQGQLPLIDPYRAGGQPLVGNPNAVPLYPDNLLYLVASPLWALNAHFWLHLLIAPLSTFWLARAWGLSRPAAWAAGVCYATSGFFFSLFNLYNLVAGAALAPAFVAACLEARRPEPRRWVWLGMGLLWGLMLLAGDPLFAALALLLAAGALALAPGKRRSWSSFALPAAASIALGTLLAGPMLVEFLRILPLSFRGYWRFSPQAALSQSWDPRTVVEWLLPLFFGRPDLNFWGFRFYDGNPPLLFSVYPGALAIGLAVLAGRPRVRAALWGWGAVAGGLFLALGVWNPLMPWIYRLPGASVLRYPVKFWLAVAMGAALICGLGFDRLIESPRGRARLVWILAALAAGYASLWLLLTLSPAGLTAALVRLDPAQLSGSALDWQMLRWRGLCVLVLVVITLLMMALWLGRQRSVLGGTLLLLVHVASQCFLLQALYDSDQTGPYVTPPPAFDLVSNYSLVVHGGSSDLFGEALATSGGEGQSLPDPRYLWFARSHFAQLYPFAGVQWGLRYELNHSPEGLDSFFVISVARALRLLDDVRRLRLLRALGVDLLLLDRELNGDVGPLIERQAEVAGDLVDLRLYEIATPTPGVQMLGRIFYAPHMNAGIERLTAADFDPHSTVVLAGAHPSLERPRGTAVILDEDVESMRVRVGSSAGGVLVTRRAFLELYRATIDGEPATPEVANLYRLAVAVPAGEHEVRLWVDRRPFRVAVTLALGALMALFATAFWGRGRGRSVPGPDPS